MQPRHIFNRTSLRRVLTDKIRADLAAPGGRAHLPPTPWPDTLAIGPDGLGADSLQMLQLAGGLNQMFHLHRSGLEDLLLARRRFGDWLDIVANAWDQHPEEITFATSGSTGAPKPCRHRVRDLIEEATEHAARLQPRRILSAVPSHHIYGFLFTVLLPALAGVEVAELRAGTTPRAGDLIVSFPEHWQYLAQTWPELPPVTGVSSTAPLPDDLARRLRDGGRMRLIEIYGSSETAGIGWRDMTNGPFSLLGIWSGVAGPTQTGAVELIGRNRQGVTTPDVVELVSPREFRISRRVDAAVQVGGINVFPARVAQVLESHPQIAEARVRLAEDGSRLKALLVPKQSGIDETSLLESVRRWIDDGLSVPERPRSLRLVPVLPKGALGKSADWAEEASPTSLHDVDHTETVSALTCT